MNRQTKALRKQGISRKVVKGAGHAVDKPFPIFKGTACPTLFGTNPASKRKSARGAKAVK